MRTLTPILLLITSLLVAVADDSKVQQPKPDIAGRPVYIILGKVIVHPKGVDDPPEAYQGAMRGIRPIALIKIDGKVVAEVYASPLKGSAKKEADEMKGSADKNPLITLMNRGSAKRAKAPHEITTIKLDVQSNLGKPWVMHSLYFPSGEQSVTFKLATGEKNFKRVLPYFDAMLFTEELFNKDRKPIDK